MKLNRNKMLAEDLTQNVFEKLIKYRRSYTDQRNFKAWLFTIARNVNIDQHRKKTPTDRSGEITDQAQEDLNAHQEMVKKEKNEQLLAALNQLPLAEKEILVLTKFEKLKFSEAAKIMGFSENALKVKSHRAIKKLREILVKDIRYDC